MIHTCWWHWSKEPDAGTNQHFANRIWYPQQMQLDGWYRDEVSQLTTFQYHLGIRFSNKATYSSTKSRYSWLLRIPLDTDDDRLMSLTSPLALAALNGAGPLGCRSTNNENETRQCYWGVKFNKIRYKTFIWIAIWNKTIKFHKCKQYTIVHTPRLMICKWWCDVSMEWISQHSPHLS